MSTDLAKTSGKSPPLPKKKKTFTDLAKTSGKSPPLPKKKKTFTDLAKTSGKSPPLPKKKNNKTVPDAALKASIEIEGIKVPILLDQHQTVIDGKSPHITLRRVGAQLAYIRHRHFDEK